MTIGSAGARDTSPEPTDSAQPAEAVLPPRYREALATWARTGDEVALMRCLGDLLGAEGIPVALPVEDWWWCLEAFSRVADHRRHGLPDRLAACLEHWLLAALRCTRPDGSPLFGDSARLPNVRRVASRFVEHLSNPALTELIRQFPRNAGQRDTDPQPSLVATSRPFAVLRSGWERRGDLIAIDQRTRRDGCRIELIASGRRVLGNTWETRDPSQARVACRWSNTQADVYEWTYREGTTRVIRTVVLIHGRRLALIAEERHDSEPEFHRSLELPPGINASYSADRKLIRLTAGQRIVARVIVPEPPRIQDDGLVIAGRTPARRSWWPLVVSWDSNRDRRAMSWRTITVAERSQACPPEVAYAARIAWGRGEGLVLYRSLGRPGVRSFLGHQTRSRFLVGVFTPRGEVLPLVKIDE